MSYAKSTKLAKDRQEAKQGDFFFANFLVNNGEVRKSPVFIVGNDHDQEDIIICSCTTQPARSDFDIAVQLKYETYVRTNKIYTIRRDDLAFKISQQPTPEEMNKIMMSVKTVFNL